MTELLNFEEAELLFYLYIRETKRRPSTHRTVLLLVSDFTYCLNRFMRGQFSNLVNSLLVRHVISVSEKSVDYIKWNETKLKNLTDTIDLNEVESIIPGPLEERIMRALFFQKNYGKIETWLSASKYASVVLCRYAVEYCDLKAFRLLLWYHDAEESIVKLYGYSLVKSLQFGKPEFIDILLEENKIDLQNLLAFARMTNRYAEFEVDDHEIICSIMERFGKGGVTFELLHTLKMVNPEDGWLYVDLEQHYWKGYSVYLEGLVPDLVIGVEVVTVIVAYLRPRVK